LSKDESDDEDEESDILNISVSDVSDPENSDVPDTESESESTLNMHEENAQESYDEEVDPENQLPEELRNLSDEQFNQLFSAATDQVLNKEAWKKGSPRTLMLGGIQSKYPISPKRRTVKSVIDRTEFHPQHIVDPDLCIEVLRTPKNGGRHIESAVTKRIFKQKLRDTRMIYRKEYLDAKGYRKEQLIKEWTQIKRNRALRQLEKRNKKEMTKALERAKFKQFLIDREEIRQRRRLNRLAQELKRKQEMIYQVNYLLAESKRHWILDPERDVKDETFIMQVSRDDPRLVGFWPPPPSIAVTKMYEKQRATLLAQKTQDFEAVRNRVNVRHQLLNPAKGEVYEDPLTDIQGHKLRQTKDDDYYVYNREQILDFNLTPEKSRLATEWAKEQQQDFRKDLTNPILPTLDWDRHHNLYIRTREERSIINTGQVIERDLGLKTSVEKHGPIALLSNASRHINIPEERLNDEEAKRRMGQLKTNYSKGEEMFQQRQDVGKVFDAYEDNTKQKEEK